MYQFMITLQNDKTVILNTNHPIDFKYANMIIKEMGYNESVKRITYIGSVDCDDFGYGSYEY